METVEVDLVTYTIRISDVTIRNSLQGRFLNQASVKPGAAAVAGEEKDMIHNSRVVNSGGEFYPLVAETFGYWTPSSSKCLRIIAAKTITYNGVAFSQAVSNLNLLQQLSFCLWKGNAKLVLARLLLEKDTKNVLYSSAFFGSFLGWGSIDVK